MDANSVVGFRRILLTALDCIDVAFFLYNDDHDEYRSATGGAPSVAVQAQPRLAGWLTAAFAPTAAMLMGDCSAAGRLTHCVRCSPSVSSSASGANSLRSLLVPPSSFAMRCSIVAPEMLHCPLRRPPQNSVAESSLYCPAETQARLSHTELSTLAAAAGQTDRRPRPHSALPSRTLSQILHVASKPQSRPSPKLTWWA